MRRISIYIVLVALATVAIAGLSLAQDRKTIVPDMKVLLENDCVRVQYHDVPVGKTIPMHSHPSYVVYTLKPFEGSGSVWDDDHERAVGADSNLRDGIIHTHERLSLADRASIPLATTARGRLAT